MRGQRIAGLDGIRALSALFVLALHCHLPYCLGGGFGVDAFFILSGYLITRNIAGEFQSTGGVDLRRFYLSRLLRLAPALVACVAITSLVAVVVLGDGRWVLREAVPALLYVSNATKIFADFPRETFPHTWSLAVEEQFYIIWPLALLLLLRMNLRAAVVAALSVAVASALWRAWLTKRGVGGYWPSQGFDTRCDGLLIGAALALVSSDFRQRIAVLWPLAIATFVYVALNFNYGQRETYFGAITVVHLSVAIIVAKLVEDNGCLLGRTLDWRPLARLGVVSYAFYLWHYPIIYLFENGFGLSGWALAGAALPFTVAAASLSYIFIERPFNELRHALPPSHSRALSAA